MSTEVPNLAVIRGEDTDWVGQIRVVDSVGTRDTYPTVRGVVDRAALAVPVLLNSDMNGRW